MGLVDLTKSYEFIECVLSSWRDKYINTGFGIEVPSSNVGHRFRDSVSAVDTPPHLMHFSPYTYRGVPPGDYLYLVIDLRVRPWRGHLVVGCHEPEYTSPFLIRGKANVEVMFYTPVPEWFDTTLLPSPDFTRRECSP